MPSYFDGYEEALATDNYPTPLTSSRLPSVVDYTGQAGSDTQAVYNDPFVGAMYDPRQSATQQQKTTVNDPRQGALIRIYDENGRDQFGMFASGSRDPTGGEIYKQYMRSLRTGPQVESNPRPASHPTGWDGPSGVYYTGLDGVKGALSPSGTAPPPSPEAIRTPSASEMAATNRDTLGAYAHNEGFSYSVDPETGYYSVKIAPGGRFPGYEFTQTGEHVYRQRAASTIGDVVGGGWTPLMESEHGNYVIGPGGLGLNQLLQSRYDETHPKPKDGLYQSRLFDPKAAKPDMRGMSAEVYADQWARGYANGAPYPVQIAARDSWAFGGHQPMAMGPSLGYLNDPNQPWDTPNNYVSTSLSNPYYTVGETPDQYDIAAYVDYMKDRPVSQIGPSNPRPGTLGRTQGAQQAWNPSTQRFQNWNASTAQFE